MSSKKLFNFDLNFKNTDLKNYLIGIDEVGRGALAGPVIACAFSWKKNLIPDFKGKKNPLSILNDSKQLTEINRIKLQSILISDGDYGLGYASVLEIEKLNILNATYLAMKRAYENLLLNLPDKIKPFLLIDGNKFNPFINARQISIIDGDTKSSVIAGASIIAKVYRDKLMSSLSQVEKFQMYKWERNVGYGTLTHRKAIKQFGLTPLHRKLFVRKVLQEQML